MRHAAVLRAVSYARVTLTPRGETTGDVLVLTRPQVDLEEGPQQHDEAGGRQREEEEEEADVEASRHLPRLVVRRCVVKILQPNIKTPWVTWL